MIVDFINEMETKISRLLSVVETLKGENNSLRASLAEKEKELDDIRGNMSRYSAEKEEIKGRIEKLLSKLEVVEH